MFAGVPLGETVEPPLRRDDEQALPAGTRFSSFFPSMLCYFCSALKIFLVGCSDLWQYLECSPKRWVRAVQFFCVAVFWNVCGSCRYATARIDNLCEDWAGDYYPQVVGQDPHRVYVQPFCTAEYHPRPHAHGIYAGPYSLRRRCMGGLGAHSLVLLSVFFSAQHRLIMSRCFLGGGVFGRRKRGAKRWNS